MSCKSLCCGLKCLSLGVLLALGSAIVPLAAAEEDGFQPIFDGQSLEGWDGNPDFWRVEDGAITGQTTAERPTRGNTFLIWRGGEVDDFELRAKFRIVGGNSGIQYRSKEVDRWVIAGYQADIDAEGRYAGILYEERLRGILALRGKRVEIDEQGMKHEVGTTGDEQAILASLNKEGWNEYHIKAVGNRLIQSINGHVTVDVTDNQTSARAMSGLLALQLHAGPPMLVQFKDIQLKRISNAAQPQTDNGAAAPSAKKKVVFVAGKPSHGYGSHEHNAGCLLLAHYLQSNVPDVEARVHRNGWPAEGIAAFDGADAVVIYCDGGSGHLLIPHLDEFQQVMDRGVGLVCIHYAVEVPAGNEGNRFLDWLGGYFEMHWSVNPHWTAKFVELPEHPITRGVVPFEIHDEWYYHMRFRPEMGGVTPILSAHPPESTLSRPNGPHSGNPHVRASVARGDIQHVAWATERADGGRSFGFTGGHSHWNWGDDNFRKIVLNAILWTAGAEVPSDGVGSPTPPRAELEANLDSPPPNEAEKKKERQR